MEKKKYKFKWKDKAANMEIGSCEIVENYSQACALSTALKRIGYFGSISTKSGKVVVCRKE